MPWWIVINISPPSPPSHALLLLARLPAAVRETSPRSSARSLRWGTKTGFERLARLLSSSSSRGFKRNNLSKVNPTDSLDSTKTSFWFLEFHELPVSSPPKRSVLCVIDVWFVFSPRVFQVVCSDRQLAWLLQILREEQPQVWIHCVDQSLFCCVTWRTGTRYDTTGQHSLALLEREKTNWPRIKTIYKVSSPLLR